MEKDRDGESFRTSTNIYGGYDTDYHTSYELNKDGILEDAIRKEAAQAAAEMAARQAEEASLKPEKKKKKRRKKNYFLRFVVFVAVLVGAGVIMASPIFDISTIKVEGNSLLSDEEIVELSGVAEGDNLFFSTAGKIGRKLKKNPYISGVSVKRTLPDIYTIVIKERNPVAAMEYDGAYVIMDDEGCAVDEADSTMYATLITGISINTYKKGSVPEFDDPARFEEVLSLIRGINTTGLFFKKVQIESSLTVKCYVTDTLICSGQPANILQNVESIKVVLYDLNQRGVKRGIIKIGEDGYASFSPVTD